jgi:diguanylate cyclase (GGDEF)-like protein
MWNVPQSILDNKDANVLLEYFAIQIENPDEFIITVKTLINNKDDIKYGKIKNKNDNVYEYYSQPYKIEDKLLGRVWSFRDNTMQANLEEKLHYQANHDSLTGLPNRAFLHDKFRELINESQKNHTKLGILFFDLDRFKLINDSFNHLAGDELLKITSKRLMSVMRKSDLLIRLGGDEFVAVITALQDKDDLIAIASKLLSIFRDPFKINNSDISVTSSMGICFFPDNGKSIDVLLRNSDIAMYRAKKNGGNQFEFYSDKLSDENFQLFRLETDLHHAIANDEFFLCYQPQFTLKNKKLISVEALLRWQHPEKGVIPPIDFIPIAEQTGLIIPIGEWVLKQACIQNKRWQIQGLSPIKIAVNVSEPQLESPNFLKTVQKILDESKLDPKYLEFELTENIIITNDDIISKITQIKEMGISLSIDDFGSGYSALSYLRSLPIDRLKIDRSFIHNIDNNSGDEVIIQAIITIAKSFNLKVIAEGVETKKQLDFLNFKNCEEIQGFYYSDPLTEQELENLLKTYVQEESTE